jgi:nuclear pore complex protein Nup153
MVSNDQDKTSCVACATAKPGGASAASAAPAAASGFSGFGNLAQTQKAGKWTCGSCMVSNDADKETCPCCSTPKPGSESKLADPFAKKAATGKWTCE